MQSPLDPIVTKAHFGIVISILDALMSGKYQHSRLMPPFLYLVSFASYLPVFWGTRHSFPPLGLSFLVAFTFSHVKHVREIVFAQLTQWTKTKSLPYSDVQTRFICNNYINYY